MFNLVMWMLVIPMMVVAIKFWAGVAKWVIRNKQTLGQRVQRVRSAVAAAVREEV